MEACGDILTRGIDVWLLEYYFMKGVQGCGRLGGSFLWEGSMFVFQSVGGGWTGCIESGY